MRNYIMLTFTIALSFFLGGACVFCVNRGVLLAKREWWAPAATMMALALLALASAAMMVVWCSLFPPAR